VAKFFFDAYNRRMNKIHLIEDNPSLQQATKMALNEYGYEVITSNHGLEAIQTLNKMEVLPDLIILDLMMPLMNGFEFRKAQLADSRLAKIPVIILTANNSYLDFKEKLQAHEFLNKPVDIKDLISILENFFYLKSRSTSSL
jgi:CheY-like chemotaxis protein